MDRELLLLGLVRERARHGYDIAEYAGRAMGSCIELKRPTAYFLLEKMARVGWLQSVSERSGRRPARRVYRLTDAGEAAFQRLLRENLGRFDAATFPGDIGLTFVDALPRREALALLAQRRAALLARSAAVQAAPPHPGALHWTIDHARRHLQTELDWLDAVIADLAKNGSATSGSLDDPRKPKSVKSVKNTGSTRSKASRRTVKTTKTVKAKSVKNEQ